MNWIITLQRRLKLAATSRFQSTTASKGGKWSNDIEKMCKLDDLTIFAETEAGYTQELTKAGFKQISIKDKNKKYVDYNRRIAQILANKPNKEDFKAAIQGYRLLASAIENNDLLVRFITAIKPPN